MLWGNSECISACNTISLSGLHLLLYYSRLQTDDMIRGLLYELILQANQCQRYGAMSLHWRLFALGVSCLLQGIAMELYALQLHAMWGGTGRVDISQLSQKLNNSSQKNGWTISDKMSK